MTQQLNQKQSMTPYVSVSHLYKPSMCIKFAEMLQEAFNVILKTINNV